MAPWEEAIIRVVCTVAVVGANPTTAKPLLDAMVDQAQSGSFGEEGDRSQVMPLHYDGKLIIG